MEICSQCFVVSKHTQTNIIYSSMDKCECPTVWLRLSANIANKIGNLQISFVPQLNTSLDRTKYSVFWLPFVVVIV